MRFLSLFITAMFLASVAPPAGAGDVAAGETRFKQLCASCHGAKGKGDGPAAAALRPRPADFSTPAWQASVNDDYLKRIIREGGPAVGKSPMMTPFGRALSDQQLQDIIAYLRSLDD